MKLTEKQKYTSPFFSRYSRALEDSDSVLDNTTVVFIARQKNRKKFFNAFIIKPLYNKKEKNKKSGGNG